MPPSTPISWGLLQLVTAPLSNRWGRKWLIAGGMVTQAAGIWLIAHGPSRLWWMGGSVGLGLGTAMVFPTLLPAVSDAAPPASRCATVGAYRFWRDSG